MERSCEENAGELGRDGRVMAPESIVFKTTLRYTSSWYTLSLVNFDTFLNTSMTFLHYYDVKMPMEKVTN